MTVASVPLGDVGEFVRGVTYKPADVIAEGVPVMATKAVQRTLVTTGASRIPAGLIKRSEQFLREGDTLVSTANSWNLVGKCCWVPQLREPSAIGGFVAALRPRHGVEPRYLYHWFSSPAIQATVRSFGAQTTNIANLNLARCREMPIPLPPIEEQRRIVDILDCADAVRTKRREALALLDDLAQSIFVDMFGNVTDEIRLGSALETAQLFTDGDWVESKDQYPKGDIRLTQLADVGDGHWVDKSSRFLTSEAATRLRCTPLARGDVLVARMPDPLGRACVFPGSDQRCVTVVDVCVIRPDATCQNSAWLASAINSPRVRAQIARLATGTTRSRVSRGNLKKILIPRVNIRQQSIFADALAEVDRQRFGMRRVLEDGDALFASLQQRAFAGQL